MADRRTILTVLFCLAAILCVLQSSRLDAQSRPAPPLTPEQKAAELRAIEQKQQAAQTPRPKAVTEIPATPQLTAAQRAALLAAAQKQQTSQQPPLRITLSDNPRAPYAGQPVLVIATPDHPVSNVTYFYEWGDRSDNTSSRVPQAPHTYASAGTYLVTVQLRATETMRQAPVSSTLTVVVNRQPPVPTPTNSGSNQIIPRTKPPALQIALNSYPQPPTPDRPTASPPPQAIPPPTPGTNLTGEIEPLRRQRTIPRPLTPTSTPVPITSSYRSAHSRTTTTSPPATP